MFDNLKPAQPITVTVKSVPRREDARQTIARLMRLDPDVKSGLKRTQEHRRRETVVRSRGKRPWPVRMKRTLVARVEEGATWSMPFFPQVQNDLASVSEFLEIKSK